MSGALRHLEAGSPADHLQRDSCTPRDYGFCVNHVFVRKDVVSCDLPDAVSLIKTRLAASRHGKIIVVKSPVGAREIVSSGPMVQRILTPVLVRCVSLCFCGLDSRVRFKSVHSPC